MDVKCYIYELSNENYVPEENLHGEFILYYIFICSPGVIKFFLRQL